MAERASSKATLVLVVASIGALAALGLVAVAFATDHWLIYTIDRARMREVYSDDNFVQNKLLSDPLYFNRYRGLFRTCYQGESGKKGIDLIWLDNRKDVVSGVCLAEHGYEIIRRPGTSTWGDNYDIRIHLMRAHFALFVVAMLMYVIGLIVCAFASYRMSRGSFNATGFLIFLAAFFTATGMAFFHGYEYLEKQKLDIDVDDPFIAFPAFWQRDPKHQVLAQSGVISYGYSYMLGWIGTAIAGISAILYIGTASTLRSAGNEKRIPDDTTLSRLAPRNKAYDYMEKQPYPGDYPSYPTYPANYPTGYPYPANGVSYPSGGMDHPSYRR